MKIRLIKCQRCGRDALRRGAHSKYCLPCSKAASAERQQASAVKYIEEAPIVRESTKEAGRRFSDEATLALDIERPGSHPRWLVRFAVPFAYSASKNHIYGHGYHVFKRRESVKMQNVIEAETRVALHDKTVKHNKIWVGLHVEKPNNKGDAINVVDLVCDGIKNALDVDDRWFCIRYLDWNINKNEPKIIIEISQEATENAIACSSCGRILSFDKFTKKKNTKLGVDRTCRECRAEGRRISKAKRATA